jgi:hypothetical protein
MDKKNSTPPCDALKMGFIVIQKVIIIVFIGKIHPSPS